MKSVICVFPILKHCSLVLFLRLSLPDLFACSTSKFFVSKMNLTKTNIPPLFLPSLKTLSIFQLEITTLSLILNTPSVIFKVSKYNS
jgi:hypothetical protein